MESSNIVPFPGKSERSQLASARARADGIESGKVREIAQPLDTAKLISTRRLIEEQRVAFPYRFTEEHFSKAREAIASFTYFDLKDELNSAPPNLIQLDPVRYQVLIEAAESYERSSQDDE